MGYTLRLKTKEGQQIVKLISSDNVGTLKEKIAELSQISSNRLNVLGGFPPKPLDLSDLTKPISQIGVTNVSNKLFSVTPSQHQMCQFLLTSNPITRNPTSC